MKYVYFFGAGKAEGTGDMKDLLGGKGAGLAEMTRIGLPVPAGFTITTEAATTTSSTARSIPKELARAGRQESRAARKAHRQEARRRQGSPAGQRALRLGAVHARHDGNDPQPRPERPFRRRPRARHTNNDRFAWDAYRRFVQMYSSVVIGLPKEDLEATPARNEGIARRERRHASHRRGLAGAGRRVQGLLQGKDRQGFPRRSRRAALGRDRRGVRVLDGREGRHLSPRREDHRACSAPPSTSCRWSSATRARTPARASASRAIPPPARRLSSAIS